MTLWPPEPPQGLTDEELIIIGNPITPRFGTPQGDANIPPPPPGFIDWINGANNLINGANNLVFSKGA